MYIENPDKNHLQSLDLARSTAALIVFVGHLLFIPDFLNDKTTLTNFLSPIHTGAVAVLFFFTLSGFVLSRQANSKKFRSRWLSSRMIRLLPVYYVSWLLPFLYLRFFTDFYISPLGIALGLTASQSFSSAHSTEVNAPLWSLSVEIWLSLVFLIIWKLKRNLKLIFLLFVMGSCYIFSSLPLNPIISGLPFFLMGILIERFFVFFTSDYFKNFFRKVRWIFLALYVLLAPKIIQIGYTPKSYLLLIFLIFIIMLLALNLEIPYFVKKFTNFLALRSYSLYAVHYPIIIFILNFITIENIWGFLFYIIVTMGLVSVATEVTYVCVDKLAVRFSKIYWKH